MSSDDPLTSSDASCLTRRHLASVSYSCHFFRTTLICSCDGYACCSCRRAYAWSSRDPYRHGDGTHATLSAADPDRGYNMVTVNADALVRLTRAVMPAIDRHPLRTAPREVRSSPQQSRLALRAQLIIVTCLADCRALHSILLGQNSLRRRLMDSLYYPGILIGGERPGHRPDRHSRSIRPELVRRLPRRPGHAQAVGARDQGLLLTLRRHHNAHRRWRRW